MANLVFVYGTLKSGHIRGVTLSNERYIGIARTMPKYTMFQYGGYPALVEGNDAVFGELYEVSDVVMMNLDEIEGTAKGLFQRKEVDLDHITLSQLPVSEAAWSRVANKKASVYLFKDVSKLQGAKNCGSLWTLK